MRPEIKVYIAAKLDHAPKLAAMRVDGIHINARWIHLAADARKRLTPVTHWQQENFDDIEAAYYFILYCEPGDDLKGAIFEIGHAVRAGKACWIAGNGQDGVDYTPDGATEGTSIRIPNKRIMPWGLYRQQIRIVMDIKQAFAEILAMHGPRTTDVKGTIIYPPKFHELG
jgi:hypothetical protein